MLSDFRAWRVDLKTVRLAAASAPLCLGLGLAAAAEDAGTGFSLDPEYAEFYGAFELEASLFAEDPAFAGQERDDISFAVEPTLLLEWAHGDVVFTFTPFARIDAADDRRTHADLREAKFDLYDGEWDATIGVDTVFWGKTEVARLVDIVNTDDRVEDLDGEDNLGQPMIRLGRLVEDVGAFTAFLLPFHRPQTNPGRGGRLRGALPVLLDADYRNGASSERVAGALRYDGVFGDVDLGLSAFHGVSRDPAFAPEISGGAPALRAVYTPITQIGVDAQYTYGATLYKLEAIGREGQLDRNLDNQSYVAASGGIEHTLFGFMDTNVDLGLIAEYAYDGRGDAALTPFQDDIVGGVRVALNDEEDTTLLATAAIDRESGGSIFRLEASRRVLDVWTASIEAQAFVNIDDNDISAGARDDSFARFKLTYHW